MIDRESCATAAGTSYFQPLEPRHLLAATFSGVDTDGDLYTAKLTGPGDMVVTTSGGGVNGSIQSLALQNTTLASTLTISVKKQGVGDGRVLAASLTCSASLNAISAKAVDLTDTGQIVVDGHLRKLDAGDAPSVSGIQLNGGGAADRTSMSFRDVGDGGGNATIILHARLTSLTARSLDARIEMPRGADNITSLGDAIIDFVMLEDPNFPLALNSLKAAGAIALRGQLEGRINSIVGASVSGSSTITPFFTGDIGKIVSTATGGSGIRGRWTTGRIGLISATSSLLGNWSAPTIATIKCSGTMASATFSVTSFDAAGVAIGTIKAGLVINSTVLVDGPPTGSIGKIDVGSWSGGAIVANSIGSLKASGEFDVDITCLSVDTPFSIKTATFKDQLLGTWQVSGRIGSLTALRAGTALQDPFTIHDNSQNVPSFVDKLKLTGPDRSFVVLRVRGVGAVTAAQDLHLDVQTDGIFDGELGLKSVVAGNDLGMVQASAGGGVGLLKAKTMTGVTVEAPFVTTVQAAGLITGGDFTVTDQDSAGFSLRTFKTTGVVDHSHIRAFGRVGLLDVLDMTVSSVKSGFTGQNVQLPADLTGFDAGGRIDTVVIRRSFSGDPALFVLRDANIVAPTLGSMTVAGHIAADNAGSIFGVGFRSITGTIKVKNSTGGAFLPTIASAPADLNFVELGGSDFRIRVYV